MATRAPQSLADAGTDRRWLLRGAASGAGAMIVAMIFIMALIALIVGDGSPGWADRELLVGVLLTGIWSLAAAAAGATGAWQAAEGGAPHPAAARLAGALGPAALIALVTVTSLGMDGPGVVVLLVQAVVEIAAAVAGAAALARRLDTVW